MIESQRELPARRAAGMNGCQRARPTTFVPPVYLLGLAVCCLVERAAVAEESRVPSTTLAAPHTGSVDLTGVGAVVESAVEKGVVAGAVVHVSQRGQPLLVAAYGRSDGDRPMTTDAIFRIASMTKPITSVAVMMLVEEGKIRLDDPLSRYLPEFAGLQVVAPQSGQTVAPARPVTIRDLLAHVSGIAYAFQAPEALKPYFRGAELADGLNRVDRTLADNISALARIPLAHQPGTAFTYGMTPTC